MEPFSTSVFKALIWIHTTTTGICTGTSFTQDYSQGFNASSTPSYSLPDICLATVEFRVPALAPSIFRAGAFGRWVVTHSLANFNFHDHRPAVFMHQHLLWCLHERAIRPLNSTFGLSHIASSAYQKWPTKNSYLTFVFVSETTKVIPI